MFSKVFGLDKTLKIKDKLCILLKIEDLLMMRKEIFKNKKI